MSNKQQPGRKPTHGVYHIRGEGPHGSKSAYWTKIGAAWIHEDGEGLNLSLDLVPCTLRAAWREVKSAGQREKR